VNYQYQEGDLELLIGENQWTLLHLAVWYNNQQVLKIALSKGADISTKDIVMPT